MVNSHSFTFSFSQFLFCRSFALPRFTSVWLVQSFFLSFPSHIIDTHHAHLSYFLSLLSRDDHSHSHSESSSLTMSSFRSRHFTHVSFWTWMTDETFLTHGEHTVIGKAKQSDITHTQWHLFPLFSVIVIGPTWLFSLKIVALLCTHSLKQ